jgi:hypothetical protein
MHAYPAGNNEGNGLDGCPCDLVRTRDLAFGDIKRTTGKEAHASLGIGRLVLGKCVERVRLPLIVADVSITGC